jgi:hypothetical protein
VKLKVPSEKIEELKTKYFLYRVLHPYINLQENLFICKRQFINFDEIFAPILLFSSMFAKSVIKIEKRVGTNAALF